VVVDSAKTKDKVKEKVKRKKGKKIKRKRLKGKLTVIFCVHLLKTDYFPTHSINIPHSPNTQKHRQKGKKTKKNHAD